MMIWYKVKDNFIASMVELLEETGKQINLSNDTQIFLHNIDKIKIIRYSYK